MSFVFQFRINERIGVAAHDRMNGERPVCNYCLVDVVGVKRDFILVNIPMTNHTFSIKKKDLSPTKVTLLGYANFMLDKKATLTGIAWLAFNKHSIEMLRTGINEAAH